MLYNQRVAELCDQLYHNAGQVEKVLKAKRFMDQHYGSAINLDAIAEAAGSSKFHLNREFKRHYGITPAHYLRDKRIVEAKQLLSTDQSSVTDACFTVGYDSLSSFSLLFRKQTGSSPSDFKKSKNE